MPKALETFQKIRSIHPGHCEADYWMGLTQLNMGDGVAAKRLLLKALDCKFSRANAAEALRTTYSVLLQQDHDNPALQEEWGRVLVKVGQLEGDRGGIGYLRSAAIHHYTSGNRKRAFSVFEEIISIVEADVTMQTTEAHAAICLTKYWWAKYLLEDYNTTSPVSVKNNAVKLLKWVTSSKRSCDKAVVLHSLNSLAGLVSPYLSLPPREWPAGYRKLLQFIEKETARMHPAKNI